MIEGIGLPAHFIVGFQGGGGARVLLDPFNGGAILTPEGCEAVVSRALGRRVELGDHHFTPVGRRQFLLRMLNNLKGIYLKRQAWDKALGIAERILLLDPGNPRERRDRGWVLVELGELRRGVADWEAYLGQSPEAPDAEWVRMRLRRVRQTLAALN